MPSSTTLHQAPASSPETSPTARKRGRQATRNELLQLAKSCDGFEIKKAAKEALQSLGFVSTPVAVEKLLDAAAHIISSRRSRERRVFQKHLGYLSTKTYRYNSKHQPVRLPSGTPSERVVEFRKQAVVATARSLMRHGASGGHTMNVKFASDASKVNYLVKIGENRNTYGGSFKGWTAKEDHHVIVVPIDWRVRVERKGLASLGGMMTTKEQRDIEFTVVATELSDDGEILYADTTFVSNRGRTFMHETQNQIDNLKRLEDFGGSGAIADLEKLDYAQERFLTARFVDLAELRAAIAAAGGKLVVSD